MIPLNDDDAFDEWLHRAKKEFVESVAASLDVDDALASVKRRAQEAQKLASDEHLRVNHKDIREAALSLSATPVNYTRRSKFTRSLSESEFGTLKLLASASTLAAGMAFILGSPFISTGIFVVGASITAQTSSKSEHDPDGGQPGSEAQSVSRIRQPAFNAGPSIPHLPANQPLQPAVPDTQTTSNVQPAPNAQPAPYPPASRNPAESEKSTTDSPAEAQKEHRVELSAQPGQDSMDIDGWRHVSNKSGDLQMDQHGIYTVRGAKIGVTSNSAAPTYGGCAHLQNWITRVDFTTLQEGSHVCVRSSHGSYAMLRIAALPSSLGSHGKFIFYGTTWQCAKAPDVRSTPSATTPGSGRPLTTQPSHQNCGS